MIAEKTISYIVPKTGDPVTLDAALNMAVLQADEDTADNKEASNVLKVVYNNVSFLWTGESPGTLKWTNRQTWLDSGDAAILQNAKGAVVSALE